MVNLISFSRRLLAKGVSAQHRLVGLRYSETTRMSINSGISGTTKEKTYFLHIAPCGDWWTGNEIFAAKHLQPDYVRSVKIPSGFDPEQLTDKQRMEIYDSGSLPNKSNGVRE